MKFMWPVAFAISLISTGVGVRVQGLDANTDAGSLEPIFYAATALSIALFLILLFDYRRRVGSFYRGSPITRMRVATITVGDIAVILLAIGFGFAGGGLAALTLAFFAHGTVASYELLALHAEWDVERAESEAARMADLEPKTAQK